MLAVCVNVPLAGFPGSALKLMDVGVFGGLFGRKQWAAVRTQLREISWPVQPPMLPTPGNLALGQSESTVPLWIADSAIPVRSDSARGAHPATNKNIPTPAT